ncbi:hypothetical protein [Microbacterium sp. 13-71-7]|uniref:hypothetical protein n=1 Tax=Microbacterium sp. 13-71-7 TaxID=1970399 RepID=UPI000BD852F4|nr:hypothetical protein [Microbacterium sp. 13-71-7]OZB84707.1 MAG: hypothetical protein B7X32_06330 [Microbacterium sp. 13-71-7]
MTTPQPGTAAPFDARALTEPVDRARLAAWSREARAGGQGPRMGQIVLFLVIVLFIAFIGFAVFGVFLTIALGSSAGVVVPLLMLVVIGLAVWGGIAWWNRQLVRGYRLAGFASANGMTYLPELKDPQLPGMLFDLGRSRVAKDLVRGVSPRFVEFANFTYTTGSGKDSETHDWGYIAIRLDVPLPNIVLDAQSNNGFFGSNLPASYDAHQRLSLEGDFDRFFALYCPAGYERDALYLFTPDIMARFMDSVSSFDVEIVDDWLFLYAQNRQVSTLDPAAWAQMFGTVGAVLTKLQQWARWRDERLRATDPTGSGSPQAAVAASAPALFAGPVAPTPGDPAQPWSPPPGVAPGGRRLKRAFPWVSVLVFAGVGISWLVFRMMLGH